MSKLELFLQVADDLHLSKSNDQRKPYKPLLLLALLCQFEEDAAVSEYVVLDDRLVRQFNRIARLTLVDAPAKPFPRATVAQPYRHLATDFQGTGLWEFVAATGKGDLLEARRATSHRLKELMSLVEAVRIDPELVGELAHSRQARLAAIQRILLAYPDLFRRDAATRLLGAEASFHDAPDRLVSAKLSEAALEASLIQNWASTPWAIDGISLQHTMSRCQQVQAGPDGRIDILGWQVSRPSWWVFELKLGAPSDAVVGQTQRYMGWLDRQSGGNSLESLGAIVVGNPHRTLVDSVRGNRRLSLWAFDEELKVERVPV